MKHLYLLEHKNKKTYPDVVAELDEEEVADYQGYGYMVSRAILFKLEELKALLDQFRSCEFECKAGKLVNHADFRKLERLVKDG